MSDSTSAIRKKRTFRASDVEYRTIKAYVHTKGRTISEFVRNAALSEIKKHVPREGLKDVLKPLVEEIVLELLKDGFPTWGNANNGVFSESLRLRNHDMLDMHEK